MHLSGAWQGRENPLHAAPPGAAYVIAIYLKQAAHGEDWSGPLFRPVSNNVRADASITRTGLQDSCRPKPMRCTSGKPASAQTHCVLRPRPTRWTTTTTSPMSRNGLAMKTLRSPKSMTGDGIMVEFIGGGRRPQRVWVKASVVNAKLGLPSLAAYLASIL